MKSRKEKETVKTKRKNQTAKAIAIVKKKQEEKATEIETEKIEAGAKEENKSSAEDKKKASKGESERKEEKEPLQAEVNIGMVGHVDHGKTTLTEKLTGRWTDTHSEELKRGISIRLGYADAVFRKCEKCNSAGAFTTSKKCPLCNGLTKITRKVSFVDAPGHETLMTTMLSGAALMQGAILVIAANEECPQPRTAEHLTALGLSDVKNIIAAQNKVDLVSKEKAIENYKQIKQFLKEFGFENAPIIPITANFGANIDLLIEAIETCISTPKLDLKKPFKMFVARSFDINKPGSKPEDLKGGVIGGSIMQGCLSIGDEIEISPGIDGSKLYSKVNSLSTEKNRLEKAVAGGLIAVGTLLAPSIAGNDKLRGQVAGKPESLPQPTQHLKLKTHLIKRLIGKTENMLKVNDLIVLTVGTTTAVGNITSARNEIIEVTLKNQLVIEKEQKVAISKREEGRWRLTAYGINF